LNAALRNGWQQLSSRWSSLSVRQKRNLAIAVVALVVCVATVGWLLSRPHYVTIMSGLDAKSLGEVQSKLEDLKIPSEINGTSVLVPQSQADEARIQLAMAGLPQSGYIGYSSVSNSFGMTEDQFNIQVLDALQRSLNQTIESIDGIESAQVHIVMPQQQLFVSQPEDTAKASVFVQLGTGVQLSPAQVAGIQQLVAHSVKGLTANNVTVVDQNGVNLSSQVQSQTTTGTSSELAQRQELEQELQQKLTDGLDRIVGPGNAVVMVHANVTFDRIQSKSHVVEPAAGQDTGLPSSQQVIRKSSTSQGGNVGGVAGQSSTNPGLPTYAGNGTGGTSQSTDDETSTQYDNSYTDTTTVHDPVQINGYDVGVMLNSANTNLTPAMLRQVQQFVQRAVGATSGSSASNTVSVMKVPFQQTQPAQVPWAGNRWLWIAGGVGLLLLLVALFIWWRRRQALTEVSEPLIEPAFEEPLPEPEASDEEQMKRQLARMAEQRPEEFANLIRTWLVSE
jgi:flagellar M-ring protein FliF